jgi:cobalt-precorrin-5B (C1)-methyltransferase|tara:strand:+ start:170 stop:1255 length:1086 start_codon:yes stop_codon:yes gene_type:complete
MKKKPKSGFTTGTCAAVAAKGAAIMLFSQKIPREVGITLPTGKKVRFRICDTEVDNNDAKCCVIKDAGDDPDVTNGAKICAKVERGEDVELKGGKGVGVVTKEGLQVSVGLPAINPVPRDMIIKGVSQVIPKGEGAAITIYVPKGEELANRTMNEKLGIIGGISILGTTGVVKPMSVAALKASLVSQIDIAKAKGYEELVLTPGRMGERRAVERGIPRDAIIHTSNYIGFMLEKCAEKNVKQVLLFGHLGKLTKVASGAVNTHSKLGISPVEIIADHSSLLGVEKKIVDLILKANTTEEALNILRKNKLTEILDSIASKASNKSQKFTGGVLDVRVILMSMGGDIVGRHNLRGSPWAPYLS